MYSLQLAEPSRSEQSPRSSDSPFLQRNKIPLPSSQDLAEVIHLRRELEKKIGN